MSNSKSGLSDRILGMKFMKNEMTNNSENQMDNDNW